MTMVIIMTVRSKLVQVAAKRVIWSKLEAFETWIWRHITKKSWMEHKKN